MSSSNIRNKRWLNDNPIKPIGNRVHRRSARMLFKGDLITQKGSHHHYLLYQRHHKLLLFQCEYRLKSKIGPAIHQYAERNS